MKEIKKIRVKPKGLGDLIEKITFKTGIATVVEKVAQAVGVEDCGCNKRKDQLNEMFPFKSTEEKE